MHLGKSREKKPDRVRAACADRASADMGAVMHAIDQRQRKMHQRRTMRAAAAIMGYRLTFEKKKLFTYKHRPIYGIAGVKETFVGLDALRDWFFSKGVEIRMGQMKYCIRHGLLVGRYHVKRVGRS